MNKKASDWTLTQIIALILLLIVAVMVIIGISTGGFNPLIKKIKGIADGVLSLFKKAGPSNTQSTTIEVPGVGKGELSFSEDCCDLVLKDKDKYRYCVNYQDTSKSKLYHLEQVNVYRPGGNNRIIYYKNYDYGNYRGMVCSEDAEIWFRQSDITSSTLAHPCKTIINAINTLNSQSESEFKKYISSEEMFLIKPLFAITSTDNQVKKAMEINCQ